MGGEVIKSFLIGLGFSVDDGSLAAFNKSVSNAALKITALYASVQVAAAGIFKGVAGIADGFEKLGYETRLIAPAISKTLELRKAMFDAYSKAGIDIVKVVKESIVFNMSLAKTKFALEAIYKSVGSKFIPVLTKQLDIFRTKIYANMPKIQASLEKMIKFLLKAFEATVILGTRIWNILGRVWDFFAKLDTATDGWSTKIIALIALWKVLNLAFLATPLGLLLVGLLAILALYDDFKTWQEGGESFFDWSKVLPVIEKLSGYFTLLGEAAANVFSIFKKLFAGDFKGAFESLLGYAKNVITFFGMIQDVLKEVWALLFKITGLTDLLAKVKGFFGVDDKTPDTKKGANSDTEPPNVPGGQPSKPGIMAGVMSMFGSPGAAPALAGATRPSPNVGQSGGIVQNNKTDIHAHGPDPHTTAKLVASEQIKVNQRANADLARNAGNAR